MMRKLFSNIIIVSLVLTGLQGCSGTGELGSGSSDDRVYAESYNVMSNLVEEALKESSLTIISVSETNDKQQMTFLVTASRYANTSGSPNQHQGKVIVSVVNDNESRVKVENPEYHYTVPNSEKEDYTRIVFNQLEKNVSQK